MVDGQSLYKVQKTFDKAPTVRVRKTKKEIPTNAEDFKKVMLSNSKFSSYFNSLYEAAVNSDLERSRQRRQTRAQRIREAANRWRIDEEAFNVAPLAYARTAMRDELNRAFGQLSNRTREVSIVAWNEESNQTAPNTPGSPGQ